MIDTQEKKLKKFGTIIINTQFTNIELAASEAMEKLKIIPKLFLRKLNLKQRSMQKNFEIEEKVKHDVIAF